MNKTLNQKAWLFVIPVFILVDPRGPAFAESLQKTAEARIEG